MAEISGTFQDAVQPVNRYAGMRVSAADFRNGVVPDHYKDTVASQGGQDRGVRVRDNSAQQDVERIGGNAEILRAELTNRRTNDPDSAPVRFTSTVEGSANAAGPRAAQNFTPLGQTAYVNVDAARLLQSYAFNAATGRPATDPLKHIMATGYNNFLTYLNPGPGPVNSILMYGTDKDNFGSIVFDVPVANFSTYGKINANSVMINSSMINATMDNLKLRNGGFVLAGPQSSLAGLSLKNLEASAVSFANGGNYVDMRGAKISDDVSVGRSLSYSSLFKAKMRSFDALRSDIYGTDFTLMETRETSNFYPTSSYSRSIFVGTKFFELDFEPRAMRNCILIGASNNGQPLSEGFKSMLNGGDNITTVDQLVNKIKSYPVNQSPDESILMAAHHLAYNASVRDGIKNNGSGVVITEKDVAELDGALKDFYKVRLKNYPTLQADIQEMVRDPAEFAAKPELAAKVQTAGLRV